MLNKGAVYRTTTPTPQPPPENTDEAMEFDVNQLDKVGKRFFLGIGWKSGRSGIDIPPGVSGAEATATGGVSFVLSEGKAKKPAAAPKAKKKFLVNGIKKIIAASDRQIMSEGEMQAYEAERAKDMRGEWPGKWPPERIEALKARLLAAYGGVDEFLCLDSKNSEILSSLANLFFFDVGKGGFHVHRETGARALGQAQPTRRVAR